MAPRRFAGAAAVLAVAAGRVSLCKAMGGSCSYTPGTP